MREDIDGAQNELIESNMGLVYACAARFKGRGVEFDDLVQSGCIGLIKAARRFDPKLGYMFSTYAVPAILGEIRRVFRDGGMIKMGRSDKEKAREVMRARERLTDRLGREPTVGELSEECRVDACEVARLVGVSMPVLSLTREADGGEEKQADVACEDFFEELTRGLSLRQAIARLDERDRLIVEMRYYGSMTQAAVALRLGMTQVSVSRREKVIISALREFLK